MNKIHQMFDLFITTLVVLETWWENTFFYIFLRMVLWQSIRWWYSSRIQQNFKWKQIYCKHKQNVNDIQGTFLFLNDSMISEKTTYQTYFLRNH